MASRKATKKTQVKGFNGRLEYRLRDSEKKTVRDRSASVDLVKFMERCIDLDFKVSYRADWDNKCVQLDVHRIYSGHEDSGYMFTARHREVEMCIAIADYVIFTVWDGKMPVNPDDEYNF